MKLKNLFEGDVVDFPDKTKTLNVKQAFDLGDDEDEELWRRGHEIVDEALQKLSRVKLPKFLKNNIFLMKFYHEGEYRGGSENNIGEWYDVGDSWRKQLEMWVNANKSKLKPIVDKFWNDEEALDGGDVLWMDEEFAYKANPLYVLRLILAGEYVREDS